jgi:hypothetical protein
MNHKNRGQLTVDLDGNWRKYNFFIPEWAHPIGAATCGDLSGVLVHQADGIYSLIHGECQVLKLDQRKVKAALGISNNAGRPLLLNGAKRCNLVLDADTRSIFDRLGDGKMSVGARVAAQIAKKHQK